MASKKRRTQVQDRWGFWGARTKPRVLKRKTKTRKAVVARRAKDGSWGVLKTGMKVW